MFTCDVEYVYIVEESKLKKFTVVEYYPKTNVAILLTPGGHRIRTSLDTDLAMYFKTPEEALQQGYNDLREMLVGAREEYQDALASYRAARKLGKLSLAEYTAGVKR